MKSQETVAAAMFQDQTEEFLNKRAGEIGKNFYHYTQLDTALKIVRGDELGNCFFYIRNIASMNDLNEAELHKTNGNKIHCFCTCSSKHEKIPLWYLYSGICGNGARIGISPGRMLKLINSIETVYPVHNGAVNHDVPLYINKDFELQCGWVYYLMDGENRVLHRNKQFVVANVDDLTFQRCFFIKDYPWEYEQEFRIIILNKTEEEYDQIAIPIPKEVMCEFEMMSAPERPFTTSETAAFIKAGIHSRKIKCSSLGIRMDLLRNNRENILKQMESWCKEENYESICGYICEKKQCHQKEEKI